MTSEESPFSAVLRLYQIVLAGDGGGRTRHMWKTESHSKNGGIVERGFTGRMDLTPAIPRHGVPHRTQRRSCTGLQPW